MAQERVLAVSELFLQICGHLMSTQKGKQALARLARCCRRFMDPTLDVLWSRLEDMRPLLDLIPALRVVIRSNEYGEEIDNYLFLGSLDEEEWYRFDFYGKRVRSLSYHHEGRVDCRIYSQLAEYRLTPMLPNLQHLHWQHDIVVDILDAAFVAEITPFLTPSLKTVSIGTSFEEFADWALPVDTHPLQLFLDMLPRRCPLTQTLSLSGTMPDVGLTSFGKYKHLQVLDLDGVRPEMTSIDGDTLDGLADLMFLHTISGLRIVEEEVVEDASTKPGFPSLHHLSLAYADPAGTLLMLNRISSKELYSFEVDNIAAGNPKTILACITRLQDFCDVLQEVSIRSEFAHSVARVGLPCIEAFLKFPRLQTVVLALGEGGEWPTFTAEYAEKMACAWPHLRKLTLPNCNFSILSLPTFASRCPSLVSLEMDTMFINGDINALNAAPPVGSHHRLRDLEVAFFSPNEEASDHVSVAVFLDRLFPCLHYGYALGTIMKTVKLLQESRRLATTAQKLLKGTSVASEMASKLVE
ncbi:hypothetical protein JAAARDRAFT_58363 [Jaapia argillacea MUCL 33604]|uniref:F-box domain-containing protein n=1 Tax=Jaapia argillacea MUCL 33604 TaxID=933084 RepID=A0A067Q5B3_9AGAM|nr:hypothetical protein JAAARDRAFT_58363 [Jaapia argillacea MUCL 33604]